MLEILRDWMIFAWHVLHTFSEWFQWCTCTCKTSIVPPERRGASPVHLGYCMERDKEQHCVRKLQPKRGVTVAETGVREHVARGAQQFTCRKSPSNDNRNSPRKQDWATHDLRLSTRTSNSNAHSSTKTWVHRMRKLFCRCAIQICAHSKDTPKWYNTFITQMRCASDWRVRSIKASTIRQDHTRIHNIRTSSHVESRSHQMRAPFASWLICYFSSPFGSLLAWYRLFLVPSLLRFSPSFFFHYFSRAIEHRQTVVLAIRSIIWSFKTISSFHLSLCPPPLPLT